MIRFGLTLLCVLSTLAAQPVRVPRAWDTAAVKDWATHIAALGVRPGHYSEADYYAAPVENVRTYPVYFPGREPAGYWDQITKSAPQPLIEAATLKTRADWLAAGKRVWEEGDIISFRDYSPTAIARFRTFNWPPLKNFKPRPDGTLPGARWVVTSRGVAISSENCTMCHRRLESDGSKLDGPGLNDLTAFSVTGLITQVPGMATTPLPGDDEPTGLWRSFMVPWIKDDIHNQLKMMPQADVGRLFFTSFGPNITPRWNGSLFYPTKVPDLIALKGQKYIDHTGTHQYRGTADIMRYAALVSFADSSDYGPHRILTDEQRRIPARLPDEALYAMALYIESLTPPPNPNPTGKASAAGQKIFAREGCSGCHAPPYYTTGKLTLAEGYRPAPEIARQYDILPVSVGTNPELALKTRKGTGFYKIPSLRGVWYRGRYLHDGAVTSLEELFNPDRLKPEFVPTGFKGLDKTRAVPGHQFGLRLSAEDRSALIAFLKTL